MKFVNFILKLNNHVNFCLSNFFHLLFKQAFGYQRFLHF